MPEVNGKKYPYTAAGKKAASLARKKKKKGEARAQAAANIAKRMKGY